MSKLKLVGWKCFEKLLEYKGFSYAHQNGSHRSYYHPDWGDRYFELLKKKQLIRGTLRRLIDKLGITRDEYHALVDELC